MADEVIIVLTVQQPAIAVTVQQSKMAIGLAGPVGPRGIQGPPGIADPKTMGIWVGSTPPENSVTYDQWLLDGEGYWGWIDLG